MNKQQLTFLSYSRIDQEFALKLARELKSSGFNVWLDQLDIPKGSRWDDEIDQALRNCDIFMVILTPSSSKSNNVKDEIGHAIDSGKRILPVLLEKCEIPFRLRRFQYVDFTTMSFQKGIEGVKDLLGTFLGEPPPTPPKREGGPDVPHKTILAIIGAGMLVIGISVLTLITVFLLSLRRSAYPLPAETMMVMPTMEIRTEESPVSFSITDTPAEMPTETLLSPVSLLETPYVVITGINLVGGIYIVDYEVHNFPHSPHLHVHMFFDTVPPERAGVPGQSDNWKLTWGQYGDPPFKKYGAAERPPGANQMCALVANPNHTVQFNTGNCVDLPNP